ncbi:MAG: diguanylate cyclase, partial [Bacillota bacterium]|nr:diguanylate cyclase [Bacillota bacterium]
MSLPFFGKGTYEEPDIKQQPAGRTEAGELPFFGRGVVVEPGGKNKDEEESSLLRRGIVDPAISLLGKGIVGAGETAVGLADIISGGHAGKALSEYAGYNPQATNEFFTSLQSPEYRANLEKMAAAKGVVEKAKVAVTNPSLIASTALESIPSMIGGWGVAKKIAPGLMKKFGPKLGLALAGGVGEGLVTASQNSEQIRQESPDRLLSTKQIALALGSGAATGAIGAVSGRIAQKLGLVDVDTLFIPASKAVGEAIPEAAKGNILKTVISGFLQEGFLEELPQSVQEQMAQNLALDKPITKGLDEAAVMGAFSGGLMGVGGNLIGRPSGSKDKATPGKLSSREQLEMARFRDRVQKDPGNIQNHLNDFLSSKFVRPEIKQEVAAAFGQRGDAAPVSPPLPPAGVAPTTTTGPQAGDQIAPVQPQPGTEIVVPEGNVEAQGIKPGTPEAQALIDETFADIDDNRQSWKTRKEFHFILDNSSNVEEAKELARQMANKNYTDPLMGINNKAAWLESQIDERDTPDDQKAWKAMYDLDNFSWFNDVLGHETGDQVLSKVGEILKETADNPFRFGGEELANIGGNDEAAYNRLLEQSEAIRNKLDNEIKIEFTIPRDIVLDSGEVYKQGDVIVVDGIGVSYGIGRTAKEADGNLISNKAERTGQKLRSKKGYEAQRVYRKVREGELVKGGARPGIESVPQKSELENLPLNEVVVHAQRAGVDFSATDNKADVINAIEGIREEYSSKPAPPTIAAPIKQTPAALPGVKTVTEPSTEAAPASNDTPAPKALDSTTKAETKEPYQKPVSEFLKESSITRNTTDTPTRQGSYYYSYKASKNGEYGDLSSSQGYDTEEEARTVLKRVHRQAVRDAIAADQFVPREVLEEYPDLLPEGMELMDKPGDKDKPSFQLTDTDARYLELAKNPEENREELQKMV